ncbi:MAG: bifunctional riboflavin kinase/FAD synthetase [Verrucomicrobiae bacterium]|nr:bifunctional riboflavin kinase/FAD synthetase [Verrucomicrobiae bacterium]
MMILRSIADLAEIEGSIHAAIGVFDGVHLGHRAVIECARESAQATGGGACVITFDPHPVRVLAPNDAPRLLTATDHKLQLLSEIGITHTAVIPFDEEFAETSAEDFVRQLHQHSRSLARICVGADWRFGRRGAGNVSLLEKMGADLGFSVTGVPTISIDRMVASSTRIREAVAGGDFGIAERLLGRPYTVLGTVITGRQLGRELGFPTANLSVHSEQLPPTGVYAVSVSGEGRDQMPGVANLGYRPSVEGEGSKRLLEVHLFDWSGDLYGHDLEVRFVEFLRSELKFDSLEALKRQIAEDSNHARRKLGLPGSGSVSG